MFDKDYDEYDEYDEDDGAAPLWRWMAGVGGLLAVVLFAAYAFGVFPFGGGGEEQVATAPTPSSTTGVDESSAPSTEDSIEAPTTDDAASTADAATTTTTSTDGARPAPVASDPAASTTDAPTAPVTANYPTLPDGRPVPILAIYDGALITLSGAVPSESAAQRLRVLAIANSTVPDAEVASFLTIEPTVPIGVGVRVIEMNSARFPEGLPTISLEHAAQLNRVAAVMKALPHITVDVIGHADQRGDDETNFALSSERARAAADYVASQGVDPSRLSSRGAGESDLLSLNNDEAALALNRRTEFVFSGLLLDAPEPT